ncbi:EIF2S2 [Lepeophtheirus salmonis]|uniref:Eukaryotic translation initiation factor 2 subunit 2 n=1 Tax=Lepeophtheirus salmonis TaxID=72036 RepID=A0A7R8CLE3_LEPSM|nr:EIF2S2 [Lepeophtheirus salmonis]CAF2858200.1 EIF2S2 [Lepeophtheirus salmonis]
MIRLDLQCDEKVENPCNGSLISINRRTHDRTSTVKREKCIITKQRQTSSAKKKTTLSIGHAFSGRKEERKESGRWDAALADILSVISQIDCLITDVSSIRPLIEKNVKRNASAVLWSLYLIMRVYEVFLLALRPGVVLYILFYGSRSYLHNEIPSVNMLNAKVKNQFEYLDLIWDMYQCNHNPTECSGLELWRTFYHPKFTDVSVVHHEFAFPKTTNYPDIIRNLDQLISLVLQSDPLPKISSFKLELEQCESRFSIQDQVLRALKVSGRWSSASLSDLIISTTLLDEIHYSCEGHAVLQSDSGETLGLEKVGLSSVTQISVEHETILQVSINKVMAIQHRLRFMRENIQSLELISADYFEFPRLVYPCPKLETLSIEKPTNDIFNTDLQKRPSFIWKPDPFVNLKNLSLSRISLTNLTHFLSKSNNLRKFKVFNIGRRERPRWTDDRVKEIRSPTSVPHLEEFHGAVIWSPINVFDPTAKKKKKKKKTPFDLDGAVEGTTKESSSEKPAESEEKEEDGTYPAEDDLDLDNLFKKKKKKKKTAIDGEETRMRRMRKGRSPMESMTRSGKTWQKEEEKEDDIINEEESFEENKENITDSPWMTSDRDYTYDELLQRVFNIMKDKKPRSCRWRKEKVFIMRPPQVVRVGTKKTAFVNFTEIARMLHRQAKHFIRFFCLLSWVL